VTYTDVGARLRENEHSDSSDPESPHPSPGVQLLVAIFSCSTTRKIFGRDQIVSREVGLERWPHITAETGTHTTCSHACENGS